MLWDAGFDQNNIIGGKPYSENIVQMMNNGVVPPNPTQTPQTLPPDTSGPVTQGPDTQQPSTAPPPVPPTKPSKRNNIAQKHMLVLELLNFSS